MHHLHCIVYGTQCTVHCIYNWAIVLLEMLTIREYLNVFLFVKVTRSSFVQFSRLIDLYQTNLAHLKYVDYGCYCGVYGSGNVSDSIDNCCFIHDACYGYADASQSSVKSSGIPSYLAINYNYTSANSTATCQGQIKNK